MRKETLKEFKKEVYGNNENDLQLKYINGLHKKAVAFISSLLKNGISLEQININDWQSSYCPSVYVGSKKYQRFAKNDYLLAIKSLNK